MEEVHLGDGLINNSLKLKYLKIMNILEKVKYFSYNRGKFLLEPRNLGNAAENVSFLQQKSLEYSSLFRENILAANMIML